MKAPDYDSPISVETVDKQVAVVRLAVVARWFVDVAAGDVKYNLDSAHYCLREFALAAEAGAVLAYPWDLDPDERWDDDE